MGFLVTIDTQAIQNYLYDAGTLRDAVGGSYLVEHATEEMVTQTLRDLGISKKDHLWYAGGGNARIIFDDQNCAHKFIRAYTSRLALEAPRLQVAVYCDSLDTADMVNELHRHAVALNFVKAQPEGVPRFMRLGFEELCRLTGEPAVGRHHDDKKLLGKPAQIRAECSMTAHDKLKREFWQNNKELNWPQLPNLQSQSFEFPKELDHLGGEEGKNYIAIVHVDVNRMGEMFRLLQQNVPHDGYAKIQQLSDFVKDATKRTVKFVIAALAMEIEVSYGQRTRNVYPPAVGPVELSRKGDIYHLPFRPILQGGDDVTFVCDGRLGICLATGYLNKFYEQTQVFLQKQPDFRRLLNDQPYFTGCAGVAIVKAHYPFRHAYALAEELLKSAKKIGRQDAGYNALDFHIVTETSCIRLEETRHNQYEILDSTNNQLHLTRKPYYVGTVPPTNASHPRLQEYYAHLAQTKGLIAHNKLKELEHALRQGPQETQRLVQYLIDTYKPPQDSDKKEEDARRWITSLSGATEDLKNSFFQSVGNQRTSYLLDIMEGEGLLAQETDFLSPDGQGLKQELFWR